MNRFPLLLLPLILGTASGELLYYTDFEDFPTGDNTWHNFEGWTASDTTSGAQAIDDQLLGGALGKVAALGFNRPDSAFTTVAKLVAYDPTGKNPLVQFDLLFGIEDSTTFTNYRRDDFFISFYNNGGAPLASIRISNQDTEYGFWYRNGALSQPGGRETDTGLDFVQGELHTLSGIINFETNRWSAAVDGIPLFDNVPFNGTNQSLTFGFIAAEWQVGLGNPLGYGDNFMLLSDLRIETVEDPPPPIIIDSIERIASGDLRIFWQASPGYSYAVEYSHDLVSWFTDLPNSALSAPNSVQTFQYTDTSSIQTGGRYYRIRQSSAE